MLSNPELAFGLSFLQKLIHQMASLDQEKSSVGLVETCMTRNVCCMVRRYDWCEGLFVKIIKPFSDFCFVGICLVVHYK